MDLQTWIEKFEDILNTSNPSSEGVLEEIMEYVKDEVPKGINTMVPLEFLPSDEDVEVPALVQVIKDRAKALSLPITIDALLLLCMLSLDGSPRHIGMMTVYIKAKTRMAPDAVINAKLISNIITRALTVEEFAQLFELQKLDSGDNLLNLGL